MMNKGINLCAIELKKQFKQVSILKNITTTFQKGETYALMGESGSGKSTFMHLLAGLDEPTSGSIMYNDQPLRSMSAQKRSKTISFVTQTPLLVAELSVYENVVLPAQIQNISLEEYKKRAEICLQAVGLSHTKNWHIGQLSGGQRQRIALVRSLIIQPDFLLADEPTGNLDNKTSYDLINLILACQKKWNMGLIISTHCSVVAQKMKVVFTIKNGILNRTS